MPDSFPNNTLQIKYHPKTGFPPVTVVSTTTNPHPFLFSIPYSPLNTLADALLMSPVFEHGMSVAETKEHYSLHFDSRIHPNPSPATPTTYKQVHNLIDQYTNNPRFKHIKPSIDSNARAILIAKFSCLHHTGLVIADPLGLEHRVRPFLIHFSLNYQEATKTFYLWQNHTCVKCFKDKSTWDNLTEPMAKL
ncbi:hypothetical protein JCM5296_004097 [Sporobolomyces johnsonii]